MSENQIKFVTLKMPEYRLHELSKLVKSVDSTVRMLDIHEGFKQSISGDVLKITDILERSKKKGE